MTNYVLKTNLLTKRYASKNVVDQVNITIEKGDIYGLIGKNGAGKTTLIRMITGLTSETEGEIELFGSTDLSKERQRVGCVIESPALYLSLTAFQNMEYYRIQRGIAEKEIIKKLLEIVDLHETGNKKVKNFSLGMKQRLALAISILGNPDFVILDEPVNGLDPIGIIDMRNMILRLNEELGITFLVSSHILPELSQIATRYGILNDGILVKQLTKKELEEECKKSLFLQVDDSSKAVLVLENQLATNNYVVMNHKEIRVFDYLENPSKVAKALIENDISLEAMKVTGVDLEEYFKQVITGGN